MPNFTTPRRRFDIGGFLLFGLSLVLFSSGIELFGEKIVATWQALAVIAVSLLLLVAYVRHARRHPTPLIWVTVDFAIIEPIAVGAIIQPAIMAG